MPIDLSKLLEPARTAVLVIECQEGILGERSPVPELASAVRESAMLKTLAGLLACAREAGAGVYHCTIETRPDGLAQLTQTPIGARAGRGNGGMAPGSAPAAIVSQLRPEREDILAPRDHGLTAFHETGLDGLLRSAGARTVVITGVSINIAITGATVEAVNRGYTAVIPTDCVAGAPASFARDALRYALRNLAFLSTAQEICDIWRGSVRG